MQQNIARNSSKLAVQPTGSPIFNTFPLKQAKHLKKKSNISPKIVKFRQP
jgi:hypothetical protein